MRAVLHIGAHKTGTTSIQSALYDQREDLREKGFFYPIEGTHWKGHHALAWALGAPNNTDHAPADLAETLRKYAEDADGREAILSTEQLKGVPAEKASLFLAEMGRHFEKIDVVCYYRQPVQWLISGFKWHVTRGNCAFASFQEFLDAIDIGSRLDYAGIADRWDAHPSVTFHPRLYRSDVLADFLDFLGIDLGVPSSRENASIMNLTAVTAAAIMHGGEMSKDEVAALDRSVKARTAMDIDIATADQRDAIMRIAAPSVERLASRYNLPWAAELLVEKPVERLSASGAVRISSLAIKESFA